VFDYVTNAKNSALTRYMNFVIYCIEINIPWVYITSVKNTLL